eukprot:1402041-Pyramimonas_sp.AAC.1
MRDIGNATDDMCTRAVASGCGGQVHPNTKPRTLNMRMGRLNITFRDHSELEEHEINLGYDGENRLKMNK